MYLFEAKNPCFVTKSCWKSSYICEFILSKKRRNWFHKNLHSSGMVGRRKLPDPLFNHIFNALLIGVQYTLSFQLTNIGLKCLHLVSWIWKIRLEKSRKGHGEKFSNMKELILWIWYQKFTTTEEIFRS